MTCTVRIIADAYFQKRKKAKEQKIKSKRAKEQKNKRTKEQYAIKNPNDRLIEIDLIYGQSFFVHTF